LRAYLAYAIILFIAVATGVQPAMAYTQMAIPFITTCDTIYMEPTEFADATISEFNSVSLVDTSLETINIDFPAFADGFHAGPVVIDGAADIGRASFNVLPFGPVNLAFPSIEQTVVETRSYQRTYIFSDVSV
jgi:hypothetical protein